jgi:hypothetical protein
MSEKTNLLGGVVSLGLYVLYILMFILRLIGLPKWGHWVASVEFLAMIPIVFLLFTAINHRQPIIYYIQLGLIIVFLLLELLLDYILMVDFRHTQWKVILYVTFFFAATGGLLGLIRRMENRVWMILGITLFLIMATLAFISRAVTGI